MDGGTPRSFRLTSKVWNYFTYEESTDTSVCCCALDSNSNIQCKARLKGRRNNNLKSHLKNKHPLDYATLYNSIQATLENSEPIQMDSEEYKEEEASEDSPLWNYFTYSEESNESSCRILDNGVMCQFKVAGKVSSKLYSHLDKFHPVEYFDVKGSPLEDDCQITQCPDESLNYLNKLAIPKLSNVRPCTSAVWSYFVYDKTNDKCQCLVVVDKDSNETCSRYVSGKNPGNLKSHLRSVHPREYLVVMQADKLSKGDISSAESFKNELSLLDESGSFEQQEKRRSVGGMKASTSSLWNYFKYDPIMNECSCEIFETGQQCDFKSPGKLHRMMIAHLKSVHFNAYVDVRIAQKRNSQKYVFKEDGDLEDNEKYMELIQSVAGKKLLPPPPATEFLTADELTRYNRGRPRNTNVCQYFVFNAELNSSFCLLKNPATNQPCPVEIIGRLSIRLLRHLKTMHPMEYVNATNSFLNVALTQGISSTAELSHFVIGMEEFISQVISKFFYFHEVVNLSVCIVDDGTGLCNAQLIGNNPTMLFSHIHNAHPVLYANLNETRLNPVPSYDNHNHGNDQNLYELCHHKIHPITKHFKYCAPIKRAICWLKDPNKEGRCCVRLDPDRTEDLVFHLKQVHPTEACDMNTSFKEESLIVVDSNEDGKSKDCASSINSDLTPEPINLIMPSSSKKSATVGIWKFFKFSHHSNSSQCQLLNCSTKEPCTFEVPGRKQSDVLEHLKTDHPEQYMKLNMESIESIPRATSNASLIKSKSETAERCKIEMAVFPDQADSLLDEPELINKETCFKVLSTPEVNELKLVISRTNRSSVSSPSESKKRQFEETEHEHEAKKEKLEEQEQLEPPESDLSVKANQPILCKYFMISMDFNTLTCCLLNTKTESICGLQILDSSLLNALQHLKDEHEEQYNQVLEKNPALEKLMSPPAPEPEQDDNILRYFNLNGTKDMATCQIGLCRIVLKFINAEDLLLHLKLFHPMEYFLAISSCSSNAINSPLNGSNNQEEESPNQKIKTVALAEFLLKSGLSIKVTEQNYFQEFLHAMDPNFRSPDILKLHEIQGKLLKVSDLESQSLNGLTVAGIPLANSH